MADKKITEYTTLATPADDDLLEIVDVSAGDNKKVRVDALRGAALSWVAPALQNSWVDAGDSTAPGYAKQGNFLYFRGRLANGTTADDTLLFTLPVGSRPPGDMFFISFTVTATAFGVLRVNADGTVKLYRGGLGSINLNGIVVPLS